MPFWLKSRTKQAQTGVAGTIGLMGLTALIIAGGFAINRGELPPLALTFLIFGSVCVLATIGLLLYNGAQGDASDEMPSREERTRGRRRA